MTNLILLASLATLLLSTIHAQTTSPISTAVTSTSSSATACASTISPRRGAPSVAPGFKVQVVANGLTEPRGIVFDSEGRLLVVEQERGVSRLTLEGDGACVRATGGAQIVVTSDQLNHGIVMSQDGRTLYASSHSNVYAWAYNSSSGATSGPRTIISDMGDDEGHTTRTLLLSRSVPDLLLVSRGSVGNIDLQTLNASTGVSTIKAFNISNVTSTAYSHPRSGLLLGWGLRNSVGIAEDPITGGIYSVENSVDNIARLGTTISPNNPGEELNYHGILSGVLNGTQAQYSGRNYGYPNCYAAWNVSEIPQNEGLGVGSNFAMGNLTGGVDDAFCQRERVSPRVTFAAHMAPLDVKFNTGGTAAWVTFHGSWNRPSPIGYKLSIVPFNGTGFPVAAADSTTAAIDIVSNTNLSACPSGCFRPVGLAWDSRGRLFMSSDATGEIYMITREDGSGVDGVRDLGGNGTGTGNGTGSGTSAPSPRSTSGVRSVTAQQTWSGVVMMAVIAVGAGLVVGM